jgi:hypothetical protein
MNATSVPSTKVVSKLSVAGKLLICAKTPLDIAKSVNEKSNFFNMVLEL